MVIFPEWMSKNLKSNFVIVVFPEPEDPTIPTFSPGFIFRLKFWKIGFPFS